MEQAKKVNKPETEPKLEPITSKEVLANIAGGKSHVFCRDRINGGEKYDYSF